METVDLFDRGGERHELNMIEFFNRGLSLIGVTFEGFSVIKEPFVVPEDHIAIIEKHYEPITHEGKHIWITGKIVTEICNDKSKREYLYMLFTNLANIKHRWRYPNNDVIHYFENMSRDEFYGMVVGDDEITLELLINPIDYTIKEHTNIKNKTLFIDMRYDVEREFKELTGLTLLDEVWESYLNSENRHLFAYDYIMNIINESPGSHIDFSIVENISVDNNEFLNQKNKVIDIIKTNPPIDKPIKIDGKFTSYIIVSHQHINRIKLIDYQFYKGLNAQTSEFFRDEYQTPGWGEYSIVHANGNDYHCYTITAYKYENFLKMEHIIGNSNEEIRTKLYDFFTDDMETFKI